MGFPPNSCIEGRACLLPRETAGVALRTHGSPKGYADLTGYSRELGSLLIPLPLLWTISIMSPASSCPRNALKEMPSMEEGAPRNSKCSLRLCLLFSWAPSRTMSGPPRKGQHLVQRVPSMHRSEGNNWAIIFYSVLTQGNLLLRLERRLPESGLKRILCNSQDQAKDK